MRKGRVAFTLRLLSESEGSNSKSNYYVSGDQTILDELKEKQSTRLRHFRRQLDPSRCSKRYLSSCDFCKYWWLKYMKISLTNQRCSWEFGHWCFWVLQATSFGSSDDLCNSLACVAQQLSSTYVNPGGISSLVACRLITINKQPGIRPIGIGEVVRRIISKAILLVVNDDVKEAAGSIQLCAGQQSGCEAGVQIMRKCLNDQENDAILLVDASNAFNTLNRKAALINIHSICPSIAVILTNVYRGHVELL